MLLLFMTMRIWILQLYSGIQILIVHGYMKYPALNSFYHLLYRL
jgi:hypothetical protein